MFRLIVLVRSKTNLGCNLIKYLSRDIKRQNTNIMMASTKEDPEMQDVNIRPEQPYSANAEQVVEVASVSKGHASEAKPTRRRCYVGMGILVAVIIGIGIGVTFATRNVQGPSTSSSQLQDEGIVEDVPEEEPVEEDNTPDQVSFVNVGCYESESSLDIHRLSSVNTRNRAYECSKACPLTRFFGVTDDICNCFVDVPQNRLTIGSCEFAIDDIDESTVMMELYFNEKASTECSQSRTETVRNFLVEEDDAPFGFDIVSNTFRTSPFELFKDECGTNIYEVQTEVTEGSQSLQTSVSEVKSFARSRRTQRVSSLSASASASYKSFLFSASAEVSASSDSEQVNLFKSSGASEDEARVFSSVGVKRLAEVKILDFDNTNKFVTLSRPFGNLLRSYLKSDFDKTKAYEIIQKYGQFVMTRGIFGGYMQLRSTMSGQDVSNSFSSEQSAKDCYEASVSAEASGFGFSGKVSGEVSGCSAENVQQFQANRNQFGREVSEESVVGGRKEGGEFIVDAQTSTLLTTIDKYPAGDRVGVQFRLLSDFLGPDKISPLEVKRLQVTEDQFESIQTNLQQHILEYLREVSSQIGGCNCTDKALPYLTEDENGQQSCFCYDPDEPDRSISIDLKKGSTWSKQGHRRTCAWDRCPSSGFQWTPASADCSCQGGLNTCYMDGPATTINNFDEATLSPVVGFDPNVPELALYKLAATGDQLQLGNGGDCGTGNQCFDDALRGGFRVDLAGTEFEFAGDSLVTVTGWSPKMRVEVDGTVLETVGRNAEADTIDVAIPPGSKLLEVSCGGWCGSCSSELFVSRLA